jgi:hypothetical protein
MNRNKKDGAELEQASTNSAGIEAILAAEEELIPSSGFLASVMESVQEEARLPQPIPFPWKLAVPGILLVLGVFGWGGFELLRLGLPVLGSISLAPPHLTAAFEQPFEQAGWVALALGVSLLSWLLSRRLAGRSGLL